MGARSRDGYDRRLRRPSSVADIERNFGKSCLVGLVMDVDDQGLVSGGSGAEMVEGNRG